MQLFYKCKRLKTEKYSGKYPKIDLKGIKKGEFAKANPPIQYLKPFYRTTRNFFVSTFDWALTRTK